MKARDILTGSDKIAMEKMLRGVHLSADTGELLHALKKIHRLLKHEWLDDSYSRH